MAHLPFIDLHAHFPMHTKFPPVPFENPLDFWRKAAFDAMNAAINYENFQPRVTLAHWFDDSANFGVTGFGSVLYNAQEDFFVDTKPIPKAFDHIVAEQANAEAELRRDGRVKVAYNPDEVETYLNDNQRFVFHTLEGGFSLGGDANHVQALAALGVASIIPAHLFYRGVATCEDGFPPVASALFRHEFESQPKIGLTDLGKAIVERCFQLGVIVDITHASEKAQGDIFDIAGGYPNRPVISSHNSVRGICNAGLNLSDDAIKKIQQSNGTIGVIFYRHWLQHLNAPDDRDGIQLITDVIDYIHDKVTGNYEHVSIGSDLDGFIQPIEIYSNYSKMSGLALALVAKYGQPIAEKILFRNALRVLHAGWAGVPKLAPVTIRD
jgi:membrane dipeptidase